MNTKISPNGIFIVGDKVVHNRTVKNVPGCVFALSSRFVTLLAAVHTPENTTEIRYYSENETDDAWIVLSTHQGHLNIINMFHIGGSKSPIAISTPEGILHIFGIDGIELFSNGETYEHDGDIYRLHSDTLGRCGPFYVRKDVHVQLSGFNEHLYWEGKDIRDGYGRYYFTGELTSEIDEVCYSDIPSLKSSLMMILSGGKLRCVINNRNSESVLVVENIPGTWISGPRLLDYNFYALSSEGRIIDLSLISENVRSHCGHGHPGYLYVDVERSLTSDNVCYHEGCESYVPTGPLHGTKIL